LETLYQRYGSLIYTLALRIVGDRELAREVLQDTFLRCWTAGESFESERGRVPGWLMAIARNKAIDMLRSRGHQARLREQEPLTPQLGGASVVECSDLIVLRRIVRDALMGLTTVQRLAIELAYYGGLTQSEIARELSEPLGTVKSRTRKALDQLRTLLASRIDSKGRSNQ